MNPPNASQFGDFYRELYGCDPFPWQTRLAEQAVHARDDDAGWPEAIALPTASGKTACIDIAVFALACQAGLPPGERAAPRRIFFVVDRRLIVDEAFERAKKLAEKLGNATGGVLKSAADALRALAGGDDCPPLACFQLRGGVYRDGAWAKTPCQPTVIASTVDQAGSRLLFRGYGQSSRSWPIHAGLAANDSLILLDEAHCAQPFMETLQSVRRYRDWSGGGVFRTPFNTAILSATPPPSAKTVFGADAADMAHPVLSRRFAASKPAQLVTANKTSGITGEAVRQAFELLGGDGGGNPLALGIVVNRVNTAREIHQKLRDARGGPAGKRSKNGAPAEFETDLLIGRMRPLDSAGLIARCAERLSVERAETRKLDKPYILISTQCVEVGANFDFDALVTECASLDALRQRFGRLNRLGRDIRAEGRIVIAEDQIKPKKDDPIYGAALPATWNWLNGIKRDGAADMGIEALRPALESAGRGVLEGLTAPSGHAPVMLPAHIDRWAQTDPVPRPDPDVALFLHGPERGAPDVMVCWRGDLEEPDDGGDWQSVESRWIEAVSLCPPASPECMSVPLHILRKWMRGEGDASDLSDVEGVAEAEDNSHRRENSGPAKRVLRWRGPEESECVNDPDAIRPGDTLAIPASLGGWEMFGHIPEGEPIDRAEEAHWMLRGQPVIRLHPNLVRSWPDGPARDRLMEIVHDKDWLDNADDPVGEMLDLARDCLSAGGAPPGVLERLECMKPKSQVRVSPHPMGGWVLTGPSRRPGVESETQTTDDDTASAGGRIVPLEDHCRRVSGLAGRFAGLCGLPRAMAEDFERAGWLHDAGKADIRFQAWLRNGNPLAARMASAPLAKGLAAAGRAERERFRQTSGYPKGARHEMLSARLAEWSNEFMAQCADPDLVLYLIASHHGRGRPFAPVVSDPDPPDVKAELGGFALAADSAALAENPMHRLDSGVPERFWRLVRKYGWWQLAYLEAVFRLADHRASEADELTEENQPAESEAAR